MKPLRAWPGWYWLFGVLVAVATAIGVFITLSVSSDHQLAVGSAVTAVIVAVASLGINAFYNAVTTHRHRLQGTIRAYAEWSDATAEHRRVLMHFLLRLKGGSKRPKVSGSRAITPAEARAFCRSGGPFIYQNGREVPFELGEEMAVRLRTTLNGLERLAAGVKSGLYDLRLVSRLGSTVIIETYGLYEPYVFEKRSHEGALSDKQPRAHVELEWLASELKVMRERRLKKDRKAHGRE